MISEPTAAVLAYDARPEAELKDKVIVVADLGGTRSDIAIIASRGGMYSILATTHDYETAGAQLDQLLVDHFAKEFVKKNKTDPKQNPKSLAKLKLEAEATKKALSLGGNASCSVESLADGIDFASTINRTRYEMLAGKVFGSFTRIIEETVRKADLDILDIDEVCHPTTSIAPHTLLADPISSSGNQLTLNSGYTCRRNFPYSTYLAKPSTPFLTKNSHTLALNSTDSNRSIITLSSRRRHPSLTHSRIRQGGHRASHTSHGNCNTPLTQRYRRHGR